MISVYRKLSRAKTCQRDVPKTSTNPVRALERDNQPESPRIGAKDSASRQLVPISP